MTDRAPFDPDTPGVHLRIRELFIINKLITNILAKGLSIDVIDEEGLPELENSFDHAAILAATGLTDLTSYLIRREGVVTATVILAHGNDEDVIADYTLNLRPLIPHTP